jgi:hypothetical protein
MGATIKRRQRWSLFKGRWNDKACRLSEDLESPRSCDVFTVMPGFEEEEGTITGVHTEHLLFAYTTIFFDLYHFSLTKYT